MSEICYWGDACTRNCVWLFQISLNSEDEDHRAGWHTSRVFLTRKEAREYGEARPYEWGQENSGWRIYGVPCNGMMAKILGQHYKEFEKEVDSIYSENIGI